MSHLIKKHITEQNTAVLDEYLTLDLTSPSGLRWKKYNGGHGAAKREAGDVAGSMTNSGVWLVSVKGMRVPCLAAIGKLLAQAHAQREAA